jgi:hypothetical protein
MRPIEIVEKPEKRVTIALPPTRQERHKSAHNHAERGSGFDDEPSPS